MCECVCYVCMCVVCVTVFRSYYNFFFVTFTLWVLLYKSTLLHLTLSDDEIGDRCGYGGRFDDSANDYNKNDENMCVPSSFANDDSFDDVNDCTVDVCVLNNDGDDCETAKRFNDNNTASV